MSGPIEFKLPKVGLNLLLQTSVPILIAGALILWPMLNGALPIGSIRR